MFVMVLSMLCALVVLPTGRSMPDADNGHLIWAALIELINGGVFALAINLAFATAHIGAKLADIQLGLNLASIFDPSSQKQQSLLGVTLSLFMLAVFIGADGYQNLIRCFCWSFEIARPGQLIVQSPDMMVHYLQNSMVMALLIIGPLFVSMGLVEVASAIFVKLFPQTNALLVLSPAKLIVGIAGLSMLGSGYVTGVKEVMGGLFKFLRG